MVLCRLHGRAHRYRRRRRRRYGSPSALGPRRAGARALARHQARWVPVQQLQAMQCKPAQAVRWAASAPDPPAAAFGARRGECPGWRHGAATGAACRRGAAAAAAGPPPLVDERQQLAEARAAALRTAASRALSFGEVLQRKLGRARAPWASRMARGAASKTQPSQAPVARRPVPVLAARALPVALPPAAIQESAAPPVPQRRKRARLTEAQKLVLCASHDGRQGLSKARATDDLLGQLSAVERWWMLGGDPGVSAVPERGDQDRILRALILSKAGAP